MHQRLGIAQALLHRPPVLLLDEPTSALDPAGRYEVLDLLDKLRGAVTVFFSTHILADVERICDTIAIIQKGRLLLVAGRDELRGRYPLNTAVLELGRCQSAVAGEPDHCVTSTPWITGRNAGQSRSCASSSTMWRAANKSCCPPHHTCQQNIILTRTSGCVQRGRDFLESKRA
jgi:ABC-2 type transport system ATP-binding protein